MTFLKILDLTDRDNGASLGFLKQGPSTNKTICPKREQQQDRYSAKRKLNKCTEGNYKAVKSKRWCCPLPTGFPVLIQTGY